MNVTAIAIAAVVISVLLTQVRKIQPEMGQVLAAAASAVFLGIMIPYIREAVNSIKEFAAYSQAGSRYIIPILKITGIAYITQLGAELCRDANEEALAGRVEMAGKIAICVITIPIAREAFIKITGIIK